jgi:hypothetical protein
MSDEELQHGCRAEYGPLELRIQTTASLSGFTVFVDDPRQEHPCVYEQAVQSTLDSAKEYVVLRAIEYLNSFAEGVQHEALWRCS